MIEIINDRATIYCKRFLKMEWSYEDSRKNTDYHIDLIDLDDVLGICQNYSDVIFLLKYNSVCYVRDYITYKEAESIFIKYKTEKGMKIKGVEDEVKT